MAIDTIYSSNLAGNLSCGLPDQLLEIHVERYRQRQRIWELWLDKASDGTSYRDGFGDALDEDGDLSKPELDGRQIRHIR